MQGVFAPSSGIWIAWLISLSGSAWMTLSIFWWLRRRVAQRTAPRRRPTWRALHEDEDGAAYVLIYVLIVPIYALFVCTSVETTWMVIAKLGTTRAAFAAARCAIVRADRGSLDEAAAREAAVLAFAPFSSGMFPPASDGGSSAQEREDAYIQAYRGLTENAPSSGYARAKYRYAATAVRVALRRERQPDREAPWRDSLATTVTYDFPFRIGAVGRFMGRPDASGRYVAPVSSTVVLPVETPKNKDESLGVEWRINP